MNGGLQEPSKRSLLLWIVVVCGCLCSQLASGAGDVSFINTTTSGCGNEEADVPGRVSVSGVTNNSATIHWDTVVVESGSNVLGYQVIYWPVAGTRYLSVNVTGLSSQEETLGDLRPYTSYLVAVRLRCSRGLVGVASPASSFSTEAAEPTGKVSNLSASLVGSGEHEAIISWCPPSPGDWNGIPYGYYVYVFVYKQESMCGGAPMDQQTIPTSRDMTSTRISLSEFCYRVIVFPVNHKAWGPSSDPLYFTFTKLPRQLTLLAADDVPRPTSPPPTPFLSSPYVYILVVGVLAVVPIVFGLVMCKKARERRSKIQYAKGIQGGDIQMYPLSPSAHLSPHAMSSRVQTFSPMSNPSPVTPSRPLLSSPMPPHCDHPPPPPTSHFPMPLPMHPAPVHSPTSPKFPLPSGGISAMGDPVFTMTRNFLEPVEVGVVFAGVQTHIEGGGGSAPHRPRANTEGGVNIPNPYEFPVHPGGAATLPRGGGAGPIPPPPSHAPPPLTQSSLEIFERVSRSPPGNGAGRSGSMGHHHQGFSNRSFSTTHNLPSPTGTAPPTMSSSGGPNNTMRVNRSASMLHPVSEKDMEGGPDYATVEPPDYIPPRKSSTLDRYPPPPQLGYPNGPTRGRRSSDESSFSEMTADNDSVQLSAGGSHPGAYRHPETGVFRPGDQRESVFSETSTEQSISSGSIREASPSGAPSWVSGSEKRRLSSSSATPTNSRTSHNQLHHPPMSPS